uniref:Oxytocin n=5 Tax=Gnathostomata TaxID=7776 RepID=NEU1_RABIT
CYIQNCPLG